MKNITDRLNKKIIEMKSPIVVGLDPVLSEIPKCYKSKLENSKIRFEEISNILIEFNKDIIDSIYDIVPVVKPEMAFYEQYAEFGIIAFKETVKYAKERGLFVIEDAKRNDIGNTAKAYAKGHLGKVDLGNGLQGESFGVDFLTVSPYFGLDSIMPFIEECKNNDKGIFVLVKTSNPSSADIQDKIDDEGKKIFENVAEFVKKQADNLIGETGYSPIGAVVGATFPSEALKLREIMNNNIFLVPGYGAQGATAKDVVNCFNPDGLGALISASRSIIYAYKKELDPDICSREEYKECVRNATLRMKDDILLSLEEEKKSFKNNEDN